MFAYRHGVKRPFYYKTLKRVSALFLSVTPLFILAVWILKFSPQPVFAATIDWAAIGWNDAFVPGPPTTQSFTNVDGSGIDMDVFYSGNMWDGQPVVYAGAAPVPPLATSLRWTNNTADAAGADGAADGPSFMTLTFANPVYLDDLTVGSLSELTGRFEWAEVRAYDEGNNLLIATSISNSTHDVDGTGTYTGMITIPGSPEIIDPGTGVYRARGVSRQANCAVGCGYDRATFVYDTTPVKRVEVVQTVTTGTAFTSGRSTGQASIVLEVISFRPATQSVVLPAAIGNIIWLDEDADGRQDTGELGIPNVVVNLTDSSGSTITTTTDADGGYLFGGLTADTYTVTLPTINGNLGRALAGLTQTTNPILPGADFGN
ncbi:MAG: hypothetical protein GY943_30805, partial [Chloroflexi bacterium]|nr:hypothetical protein [Chloroflexota bacterium]